MKKLFLLLALVVGIQSSSFSQDLFITSIDGVKSIKRYGRFSLNVTVKNGGVINITKTTQTSVYLSTDNTYGANDLLLGNINLGAMNAGQSKTVTLSSPSISWSAGTYYLVSNVDKTNVVVETNESNNLFVEAGYAIQPPDVDFHFTSFRVDKLTATPHDAIYLNYTAADKGATALTGNISLNFYLSNDKILDGSDRILETHNTSLSSGNKMTSEANEKLVIPGNVVPGSYYIIVKINDPLRFEEADASNNTSVSERITINAANIDMDFSGQSWHAFTDVTDGTYKVSLIFSMRNSGTTPVADYSFTVYTIQAFTPEATRYNLTANALYQKCQPKVISPGQTIEQSIEISLAPSDPMISKTFGLVVVVNEDHRITEMDYTNNELMFTIGLGFTNESSYDHGIVSVSTSGLINDTDSKIPLQIMYRNSSSQEIQLPSYENTISIRNLNHYNAGDGVMFVFDIILPGQNMLVNTNIDLYKPLPAGTYMLEISNWKYPGFSFKTVIESISPRYTYSGSIKGEDGTPITDGELFLFSKNAEGVTSLVQQVSMSSYSNFNFTVGKGDYALYFVPDEANFSEYVPTVMTKSLILSSASFANVTASQVVDFQVFKTNPVEEEGSQFIEGSISAVGLSSGRMSATTSSPTIQNVTVVLFSENDQIIAHTKSDAIGHYKFENLPAGNYKVLPIFPFDHFQLGAPTEVDLTRVNAQVNFLIQADGVVPTVTEILLTQTLTFPTLSNKKYKDEPFMLEAISDAGLPITFSSSNSSIAEVIDDMVWIRGVGEVTITASQVGDDTYQPASANQVFIIEKADQILWFDPLPAKIYNDASFALTATADSELPVNYTSANESVAEVVDGLLVIRGAGSTVITASQPGNELYIAAESKEQTLVVAKATQMIVFEALPIQTEGGKIELPLNSSAGLAITYTSNDETVATVEGNILHVLESGEATITATQQGDNNYEAALPVTQTLQVEIVLGDEDEIETLSVWPNPTTGKIKIKTVLSIRSISITDMAGQQRLLPLPVLDELNIDSFAPGIYVLTIQSAHSTSVLKIVKK